jgi:DNA-binding LytR/AlgR family response regulator
MKSYNENIILTEKLKLSLQGKLIIFNTLDLSIIEGHKRGTKFFIDNEGIHESSYSIGHFEFLIDRCNLKQVHRSFFISIDKVDVYYTSDETILMKNKELVPLGKKYKKEFLLLLEEFRWDFNKIKK